MPERGRPSSGYRPAFESSAYLLSPASERGILSCHQLLRCYGMGLNSVYPTLHLTVNKNWALRNTAQEALNSASGIHILFPHCFYSGCISMQKPFPLNIPRHNKIAHRRTGLGLNKKFHILAIHLSGVQRRTREIRASANTGHLSLEIMKGAHEAARASLCLRRQAHLQQRSASLYLFQASLCGRKSWVNGAIFAQHLN